MSISGYWNRLKTSHTTLVMSDYIKGYWEPGFTPTRPYTGSLHIVSDSWDNLCFVWIIGYCYDMVRVIQVKNNYMFLVLNDPGLTHVWFDRQNYCKQNLETLRVWSYWESERETESHTSVSSKGMFSSSNIVDINK